MDSSQPLAALEHIGGDPMCFIAAHGTDFAKLFDDMIGLVKPLALDIEKVAESQAKPEQWAEYMKYRDRVLELVRRIEVASREKVIPAPRSNEQALVFDVASKSAQWFQPMPKANAPLPIIEFGLVCRVNNAALLRQGIAEYVAVAREASKLLHEIAPNDVPELELPAPRRAALWRTVRCSPIRSQPNGASILSWPPMRA